MDSDEYETPSVSTTAGTGTSHKPKRKRESSKTYSAAQEKQRIRAQKNRISAQKSRDRQKQYIVELEASNGEMREKLARLETQNKLLSEKLDMVLGLLGAKKDESAAIAPSAADLVVPHHQQLQQVPTLSLALPQKSLDSSNSLSVETTTGPLSSALVSPFAAHLSERSMSIASASLQQQQQDDELEMLEFLNSSPTEEHPAPSSLFLDMEAGDSCISDPSTSINTFSAAATTSFTATDEQKAQFDSLFSQCFDDSLYDHSPSLTNVNASPFSFTNPSFSAYASSSCAQPHQQSTTVDSPSTSSLSTHLFPAQQQQHNHHQAQQSQFDLKSDPAAIITDFSTLQQFRSLTFAPHRPPPTLSSSLNRISCDPLVSLTLRIPEISLKIRNTPTTLTPPPTPLHFFLNWEEDSWRKEEEEDKITVTRKSSTVPRNGFQVHGPVLGKKKSLPVFEKKFPISFAILQRM